MPKPTQPLTVKEAAQLLEVTTTTLRNWDRAGKLVPRRDPINGYRLYALADVQRIIRERGAEYIPSLPDILVSRTRALDTRTLRHLIRQMSAAFRDSQGGGLLERFEEITKLLYAKLYDEQQARRGRDYERRFVLHDMESAKETYQRVADLYRTAVSHFEHLALNGRGTLGDDEHAVARVVQVLEAVSFSEAEADVKGAAYEELVRNSFEKSENQQFFTPRTVVRFMVEALGIEQGRSVCDPACGSGGFLTEALSVVGESSAVYGMEIDKRMAWVAQMNLLIHGGEHAVVLYEADGGSLGFSDQLRCVLPNGGFDYIITNPPFGSDFSDKHILDQYALGRGRNSRRRGVLFVERCIEWLKAGTGRLAIVLDDSILNGNVNSDVRDLILRKCVVDAVISLPEVTFKPYASVETSILLLRKRSDQEHSHHPSVFMAAVEEVGRKANGDPLLRRDEAGHAVLHNDLDAVLAAWRAYQENGRLDDHTSPGVFICAGERFEREIARENRLDVLFHHPTRDAAEVALRRSPYPTPKLAELVEVRNDSVVPSAVDPAETWRYVGLAQISPRTGEYEVSEVMGDEIKSAVRRFEAGDIVFSKLRPELRKCFLALQGEEAYASGECFVFRPNLSGGTGDGFLELGDGMTADSSYLSFLLRSDLVFGQLVYQITGTGRPRVSKGSLLNLRIPLPPVAVQREIVAAQELAERQYRDHRHRSAQELARGAEVLRQMEAYAEEKLCRD